jgi:hypothetical protein
MRTSVVGMIENLSFPKCILPKVNQCCRKKKRCYKEKEKSQIGIFVERIAKKNLKNQNAGRSSAASVPESMNPD